jgi:hypothetical protein
MGFSEFWGQADVPSEEINLYIVSFGFLQNPFEHFPIFGEQIGGEVAGFGVLREVNQGGIGMGMAEEQGI